MYTYMHIYINILSSLHKTFSQYTHVFTNVYITTEAINNERNSIISRINKAMIVLIILAVMIFFFSIHLVSLTIIIIIIHTDDNIYK